MSRIDDLLQQAEKCRRLAASASSTLSARMLRSMAEECLAEAKTLQEEQDARPPANDA